MSRPSQEFNRASQCVQYFRDFGQAVLWVALSVAHDVKDKAVSLARGKEEIDCERAAPW